MLNNNWLLVISIVVIIIALYFIPGIFFLAKANLTKLYYHDLFSL